MISLSRARVGLIYWWRHGRWPALEHPRRFTEWVQWRKLHDRDPDRSRLTDKSYSKAAVAALLGEDFIIPTLWEGAKLPVIPPWPLPFVVKANHGCGQTVVVRTAADYRRALRVSPRWLAGSYGNWLDEWHYRGARRSILVEPFVGTDEMLPVDYKVYVFGGRAVMVQLHRGRGGYHRWSHYDHMWQLLSSSAVEAAPPVSLKHMLAAAGQLGQSHDFLRVDFYEIDGRPVFGEFCLYPGSGLDRFDPEGLDDWLGAHWIAQSDLQINTSGMSEHSKLAPQTR